MKNRISIILFLLLFTGMVNVSLADNSNEGTLFGYRFGIGGGMGITAISPNDLVTYLNMVHVPDIFSRISEFSSAVEFFGSIDMFLRQSFAVGFEYSYLFGSHNIDTGFGTDDFSYSYHMPIILGHYLLAGTNYFFKFGGGLGYYFSRYKEELIDFPEALLFTGSGIGGKAHAVGHTPFGDNLYGYIGVEIRFGFPGRVSNEDDIVLNDGRNDVTMNFFSFGLKFGLTYNF